MKKQQSGFTLIELVVVIVILGILAAVATPRFVDLTGDAEAATCQGVVGALMSTAVLLIAENNGAAQARADIISETATSGVDNVAEGTSAGIIDVTVGGTTCSTPDMNAAGLSSD